jgi:hypothetical protein
MRRARSRIRLWVLGVSLVRSLPLGLGRLVRARPPGRVLGLGIGPECACHGDSCGRGSVDSYGVGEASGEEWGSGGLLPRQLAGASFAATFVAVRGAGGLVLGESEHFLSAVCS